MMPSPRRSPFLALSSWAFLSLLCWFSSAFYIARPAASFGSSFLNRKSVPTTRFINNLPSRQGLSRNKGPILIMRDKSSSYWFHVGDTVRVVSDNVYKAGVNLQGRVGIVKETWEKCDVDPTCCCAEQVDENMAVRVEFDGMKDDDPLVAGTTNTFTHYFAEEELVKVAEQEGDLDFTSGSDKNSDTISGGGPVAFDGMSCVDLKLNHLQSASSKPRGIASYEPGAPAASQQQPSDDGQI